MAVSQTVDTTERLAALRSILASRSPPIDAFVVPSEDAHFSEFPSRSDARRAFISGFDGSAGCAIVTSSDAYLFTDGRYFLQASKQLDKNWTLMKTGLPGVPTWQEFLSDKLEKERHIGIDPTLISAADAQTLRKSLEQRNSDLVPINKNPVDDVWGSNRPPRVKNKVYPLEVKYSGRSLEDKIADLREKIQKKNAAGMVVNMLDEVAWLVNLRGADIDYNPVFFAYVVLTLDKTVLFIDKAQVGDDVRDHLGSSVELQPYESIFDYLKELSSTLNLNAEKRFLLSQNASLAIANAIGQDNFTIAPSLVAEVKAIKNDTELAGFRQCHIRDGSALVRYLAWLEEQLNSGASFTESQVADKLEEFRSELQYFKGLSFPTISAAGPNAAVIHYLPERDTCSAVRKDQVYLCDSGAQFLDGTTDVTRTWHFGTPTDEEKRAYTRVLQGHIALDTLVFPNGTTGFIIDAMARRPLWQDGLDYRHGTGHGVGHFLNVHEGPHGIGVRIAYNNTPLKAGMIVTNEPGYYEDGHFGIRTENVLIVREAKTPNDFGSKGYLCFENVTMCPIQTKLIAQELLTPAERTWVNKYHEEICQKLSPLLANDTRALAWLERECTAI
ncbi:Creatinase/aminopeptidase [Fomitiporia mediterranea MF3/22]|uniref:Creatinase/aminopeptidase n=1 Tax=Fomitiporia mediterranea (strain MF3/22) TaxID=694068 RepID=UPI0004407B4F|nr:Creatinase/aminopeptidase [Fomitiporia mediterranea MF3/22]EJD05517.1 Creatinase/aminopeptidase [Fomitiporia mediterranea MF3/22]